MIAEVKHYLQERKNIFWFFLIIIPLQLFILCVALGINFNTSILFQDQTLQRYYFSLVGVEFVIYFIVLSFKGYMYIDKTAMCKNVANYGSEDNEYSAVLIGNNLSREKNIHTYVGACGLYLLIKYFKNTNKHYIICQKVDKSQFDRFVLDDKCQELFILGHGSKRNFKINNKNDGKRYYSEYKDAPKKRIVAQLHCANTVIGKNNESLVDLLATDKENSYVGSGDIIFLNEWFYYIKLWIKNRPKKVKR